MIKTNHYRSRIQQRGVLQSTVDLAIAYGSKRGDKFILGKKQLRVVLAELDYLERIIRNSGELVNETSLNPLKVKYIFGFSNKSWKLVDFISGL